MFCSVACLLKYSTATALAAAPAEPFATADLVCSPKHYTAQQTQNVQQATALASANTDLQKQELHPPAQNETAKAETVADMQTTALPVPAAAPAVIHDTMNHEAAAAAVDKQGPGRPAEIHNTTSHEPAKQDTAAATVDKQGPGHKAEIHNTTSHKPAKHDTAAATVDKQTPAEIQNTMNHEPPPQALETASVQESGKQQQAAVPQPPLDVFPETLKDVDMTATETQPPDTRQQPTSDAVAAACVDNVEADLEKQLYEDIVQSEQDAVMRAEAAEKHTQYLQGVLAAIVSQVTPSDSAEATAAMIHNMLRRPGTFEIDAASLAKASAPLPTEGRPADTASIAKASAPLPAQLPHAGRRSKPRKSISFPAYSSSAGGRRSKPRKGIRVRAHSSSAGGRRSKHCKSISFRAHSSSAGGRRSKHCNGNSSHAD